MPVCNLFGLVARRGDCKRLTILRPEVLTPLKSLDLMRAVCVTGSQWDSYRSVLFLSVNSFNIGDIFNMTVSGSVFELGSFEMGACSKNGEQKNKLKFDPMPHNDGFLIKLQA